MLGAKVRRLGGAVVVTMLAGCATAPDGRSEGGFVGGRWGQIGETSETSRLSWVGPFEVTIVYSISPSVIFTFVGNVTVAVFRSSRIAPISKTPGATSLGA